MSGPLSGIKIADFTQLYQGPLATQILSDMGADIIKIEPPKGDFFRNWALGDEYLKGESISFLSVNRNKWSIVLDLKKVDAVAVALKIIRNSDVVIENFRPGVMTRLGLDYETLSRIDNKIIYCASSGYGQDGPYVDYPGQDMLIQAITGTLWMNGRFDDPPIAVGFGLADVTGGLHIVMGVLAAIIERSISGNGQRVDVNLLNSQITMLTHEITYFANTKKLPVRPKANSTGAYSGAPLGIYKTKNGYLVLAMMSISLLANVIGAENLAEINSTNEMPRRDEIHAEIESVFMKKDLEEWLIILRAADIWCAPVKTFDEMLKDEQVNWNKMIQEVSHPLIGPIKIVGPSIKFSRTPGSFRLPPPLLGEHTMDILAELGYDAQQIDKLLCNGSVATDVSKQNGKG
jgi:crotonobetainyl-CoA:carnitine CoA-transferase CaiB-like acyl-CoA transferase